MWAKIGALEKIPEQRLQDVKDRAILFAKMVEVAQLARAPPSVRPGRAAIARDIGGVCECATRTFVSSHLQFLVLARSCANACASPHFLAASQDCALSASQRPESSRMFTIGDVVSAVSAAR